MNRNIVIRTFLILLFAASFFTAGFVSAKPETGTILTAQRTNDQIILDGHASESSWADAKELVTFVEDGTIGRAEVRLRALYDTENIYFFVSWPDSTESDTKKLWTYKNGSWEQSGEEDRFSFVWNINDSINGFNITGCAMLCHGDRMRANNHGELGDMWEWKASRSNPLGVMDDKWVDSGLYEDAEGYDPMEAGLHKDEGSKLDIKNRNEGADGPRYFEPEPTDADDAKFLLLTEVESGEAVEIQNTSVPDGTSVPGYILQVPDKSRGDISAKGLWSDGRWNVEISRKLVTGHDDDVQFDTSKTYRFGIAIMDNSGGFEGYGTGHSFAMGAMTLEFGGRGSEEVVELSLIRDYLILSKTYVGRGERGLALSTISNARSVFEQIKAPVADADPDLFIKIRNGFVDSRRNPSPENIDALIGNVELTILTLQGKRIPPEASIGAKILDLWGKISIYIFLALAAAVIFPIWRLLKSARRPEFRGLNTFMLIIVTPILLEGVGRLGAFLRIPLLPLLSFTTSEYATIWWVAAMFIALYVGRYGFNEVDRTLGSLEEYSSELKQKSRALEDTVEELEDARSHLEYRIDEATKDLKASNESLTKKVHELERWQGVTVDRELKMADLKKEVKNLKDQLKKHENS